MENLTGQAALITGAGRGIGRAAALAFARRGLDIIGVARTASDLASLGTELRALGRRLDPVVLDLSTPTAASELLQIIEPWRERITVLDCNATIMAFGPFADIPWDVHERIVRLNVLVPLQLLLGLLPSLRSHRHSWVFFMSSQGAMQPVPWMATQGAVKACIQYQSLALDTELRRAGVHAVTVIPAHSDTTAFQTAGIPGPIKQMFGRGKSAQDIADRMAAALREKPPLFVTNVPAYSLLRAGLGLMPLSWQLFLAGQMFSSFQAQAFYPKT